MRRRVIAGNWKMYKTLAETRSFFTSFLPLVASAKHCDIVVAPPFTAISTAAEAAKNSSVAIAGQNVSWSKEGAFTGEVSALMLAEAGCRYVISGPGALTPEEFSRILIAYEPVWAIGTGRTATPEIAAEAHRLLRRCAGEKFSVHLASALRILYGGSVKPDNIQGLMAQEELDGALVGGASLDAKSFAAIVEGAR